MSDFEIFLLALGLSADAFAIAMCEGLKMRKLKYLYALIIALFFGSFQALMPTIGWLLGNSFKHTITKYGYFFAFFVLAFIGGKMMYDGLYEKPYKVILSFEKARECLSLDIKNNKINILNSKLQKSNGKFLKDKINIKNTCFLAFATSIDAFSTGIALPTLCNKLFECILTIGIVAFAFSFIGVIIGSVFGSKYSEKAKLIGGIILVLIGIKLLYQGMFSIKLFF